MTTEKLSSLQLAGQLAATIHQKIHQKAKPGVNLLELEAIAKDEITRQQMKPAFLGYKGYPAVTCLSVNNEIVHGIPRSYILRSGDILSVDLGVSHHGWIVDTAQTHAIGEVDQRLSQLISVTEEALNQAINVCRAGNRTGDIGEAVESYVAANGFFVVEDLTGHGVGKTLQEAPTIYNFGKKGQGTLLKEGMVLAIEPIITDKETNIVLGEDGWTILSDNGAIGAHFEHTVMVTKGDALVLTK